MCVFLGIPVSLLQETHLSVSTACFCFLFVGFFIVSGVSFAAPWEGYGTTGDPYRIRSFEGLAALSANNTYWGNCFILEN